MLEEEFVTLEIGKTKHIALVAHDGRSRSWWTGATGIKRY
mgnify:CR=1 FL=1